MEAGIRELRDHLSRYLDQVRSGTPVVVTDRGRAIARIVPLDHEDLIDQLVRDGLIELPSSAARSRPHRRVASRGGASDLVEEQRR